MKRRTYLFLYIFLFFIILPSPFWLWQLKPYNKLNVLIMDKTVPDKSYREHKGLIWILDNAKYVKSDLKSYTDASDYKGFVPGNGGNYSIARLPKSLEPYNVIYLTDQYGVYKNEYSGVNQSGNRSEKIAGGLSAKDTDKIEQALITGKGKTLISEFNTFASPTSDNVRDQLSNLLNLDWSGWIGRYFSDLNNSEVPAWVKKNYEKENRKWNFSGQGFVFVNKNDSIVVVDKKDIEESGILFKLTNNGKKYFNTGLSGLYQYWFDINEAKNKEDVLASYHLPISAKAKQELKGYGIPSSFPAVIYHQNIKYSTYYFAGDYADESEVPGIYQAVGFDQWRKFTGTKENFYWNVYVPMMKDILQNGLHRNGKQDTGEVTSIDGIKTNSRTGTDYIQIKKNGKWENLLIKGVNMGIGKPGYFPGETAITKSEYLRWFKEIGDMDANTIRVYTLHPPAFYEAFYEYNQTAKKPLYLIHGAWVNEEVMLRTQNAFAQENGNDAKTEIKNMIDIIHGHANLPVRAGHASGTYKYDISKYVLGFIIGTEWDPQMVNNTNKKNKNAGQFNGSYFKTKNASPFEVWLAGLMNYAADYETKSYNWQHSISFTNWVTTDLLKHPYEPLENEDLASVNPNHIAAAGKFHSGLFASYHIYPYYPDFLNYTPAYLNYIDSSGKKNNYAGYLHDLRKNNHMPVLVAEFGVPSSRGLTHLNKYGMNQGFHSEQEQGEIDKKLYTSIVMEKYAGGMVFSWQDEWFKRTWNTMDYDDPNRRPYWDNVQTNEQHFGLLGFEPGTKETSILVDGGTTDWKKAGVKAVYQSKDRHQPLNTLSMYSDSGYLYFLLTYHQPVDFAKESTYLLFDTIDNQGETNFSLNGNASIHTDYGIDFLVKLAGPKNSRIMTDSYYDPFYYQYANILHMLKPQPHANQKDNGVFNPIRLALNKEQTIPATKTKVPFSYYETGKLLYGDANPQNKDFNSLTDISVSSDKKVIEGRIPWQLLNMKDPSTREAMGDIWKKGLTASTFVKGIHFSVVLTNQQKAVMTYPKETNTIIKQKNSYFYSWKTWEEPVYYERLKKSYDIMKQTYQSTTIKDG